MRNRWKRAICSLWIIVLLLGITACGETPPTTSGSAPASGTETAGTTPTATGLPARYKLEVQQTGERSGVIRFTDPTLQEQYNSQIDEVGAGYLAYGWEVYLTDSITVCVKYFNEFITDRKTINIEDMWAVVNYIEPTSGESNYYGTSNAVARGQQIIMKFEIPEELEFNWDMVAEYRVIVSNLSSEVNLDSKVSLDNSTWDDAAHINEPDFRIGFEDRCVIIQMKKPTQDISIVFGDFNLEIRTNQGEDLGDNQRYGMIFDLMSNINTHPDMDILIGMPACWGENKLFVKMDIPGKLMDKPNEFFAIDWNRVSENPIIVRKKEDGAYLGLETTWTHDEVVVPYDEMISHYLHAWTEQQLQQPENPLPERGTLFDLPADFGYEAHDTDEAYFFCYSEDYIVAKFDLRNTYVDSTVTGKADMYVAYNFDSDGVAKFEMVKYVLEDHFQALQFVRDLHATSGMSDDAIGEYVVADNVVYPYNLSPPDADIDWKNIYSYPWANPPYASGPNDIWLMPHIWGFHPAAIVDIDGYITHYSKDVMIDDWQSVIENDNNGGKFHISKP